MKFIIKGTNTFRHYPYMTTNEYYGGGSYVVQHERYAVIRERRDEAKVYSSYERALKGADFLLNKCINISGVQIVPLDSTVCESCGTLLSGPVCANCGAIIDYKIVKWGISNGK